jgi:hypothetical protein
MKPQTAFVIVTTLIVCSLASAQSRSQPPLASPAELQQMFDSKQYNICLQQIARIARAPTSGTTTHDPDGLQLLRADCYMQLKDRAHALRAFDAAQKSEDPKISLRARASYLLVQASPNLQYPTDTGSVDIVNPESRRKAMSALFAVERKKADPAIQRAQNARTIEPIIAVVPKLKDLTALELTATGADKEIFPAFSGVGARARDLIAAALPPLNAQISTIEQRANESVTGVAAGGWWVNSGRRGLDTPDRAALEQLVDTTQQTAAIAAQGLVTAKALNGNVEQWQQLANDASNVANHARNVLEAE